MEQVVLPVFFFLQIGDYLTTIKILNLGGRELNPIMKWIIDKAGLVPAMFFSKVAIIMGVWWMNNFWLTLFLAVFYMAVVGNNLFQLKKIRR